MMTKVSFPKEPTRAPTKRELKNFNKWKKYLSDSKLSQSEIYSRAASLASSEGFNSYYKKNYR